MPNKKKYQSILNDPIRYKHYLSQKRKFSKRYYSKHPLRIVCSRLRHQKGMENLSPFDLWKILKKQKMICPISGDKLTKENFSIDHIIPLIKGGKNEIDNLQFTIKEVNVAKFTMSTQEFIRFCHRIAKQNPIQ